MAVGVFANCVFFLKVNHLSAQEKKRLKACIKDNGGIISFVLNKQCTHVIAENADSLTARHLQNIMKNGIPIVDVDFVMKSGNKITKSCNKDLGKRTTLIETPPKEEKETCVQDESKGQVNKQIPEEAAKEENKKSKNERIFMECDPDSVNFDQDFEVAKYAALEKMLANLPNEVAVIEIQCLKEHFQIMFHVGLSNGVKKKMKYLQFETSEEACERFQQIIEGLKKNNYKLRSGVPQVAVHLASGKLQEVLLQDAITATSVSQEVGTVVELIWLEALGHLDNILQHPVNKISLNDVSKAEGILLQVRKALDKGENPETLKTNMAEFYRILPHKHGSDFHINKKLLSAKEDLCQVVRDIVSVCETNMSSTNPPSLAKYRALRCMIQHVDPSTTEYIQVKEQVLQRNHSDTPISILNIYKVGRVSEAVEFESNIGKVQSLLHASAACNFVGILSRGLLLPKMVVEDYGVERTDVGNLGSGIYFTDSISTSMKYSSPTQKDGSRLLVVCDVALGDCLKMHSKDYSLMNAPSGYQSVHGIRKASAVVSDFEDDEFVVYKTSQVKMKYIVQFSTAEDKIYPFCPDVNVADLEDVLPTHSDLTAQPDESELIDIKPLEEVKGGLQDTSGNPIPLEGVYIKGKILDLIAQVVVFQKYTNRNSVPIEAKYVFPLDSTAAVCGFEAFINGKHIIGEVKEKEQAHREYREAVSKGHGAYLMDQDAPDVFTVSVGNLPPNATVLIKITYITELTISYGSVTFMVPGAVAPWQEDKALNENTQDTVEKICVKEGDAKKGEFSLDLSVEMPFKINEIWSYSHTLKYKKTDCKAVISTAKNSGMDSNGFTMIIQLDEANVPRMWVEKHPDKESEACMLVFQPDFDTGSSDPDFNDIIICLDCSNSMSSVMNQAKKIAILAVNTLHYYKRLNIIKFGSNYEEFCSFSKPVSDPKLYEEFIKSAKPTMGNTDFWKPLHSLSLLAPSKGVRNIILISDGHIQDESRTLQIVKNNVQHTRVFTCGVGSTANRHMLRSLAKYGSGAFEYFDEKSKYSWENKINVQIQRTESPGCNAVSIKWQQFGANAPVPMQAPVDIQSIFKSERVLVYGFVPHCTQAALHALIREQEIDTMVSTTELQKTTGTILHKLTARALIRDYEDGILHENENEHEMKKHILKCMIIDLSKEYSIVTQFTSFVAIEKRDADESPAEVPDIQQLIALEDVDILPYMTWEEDPDVTDVDTLHRKKKKKGSAKQSIQLNVCELDEDEDDDVLGFCLMEDYETSDVPKIETVEEPTGDFDYLMFEEGDFMQDTSVKEYDLKLKYSTSSSDTESSCESVPDMAEAPEMPDQITELEDLYEDIMPQGDRVCQSRDYSGFSSYREQLPRLTSGIQSDEILPRFGAAAPQQILKQSKVCLHYLASKFPSVQSSKGFQAAALKEMPCLAEPALPAAPGQASFAYGRPSSGLFGSSVTSVRPRNKSMKTEIVCKRRSQSQKPCSAAPAPNITGFSMPCFRMTQERSQSAAVPAAPILESVGFGGMSLPIMKPCSAAPAPRITGFSMPCFGFGKHLMEILPPPPPPVQSAFLPPVPVPMRPKIFIKASANPHWADLFQLQTLDHYWEPKIDLGLALKVKFDYLVYCFLPGKGLQSLGPKGRDMVLRLIATLLVLQALWLAEELSGIRFKSLLKLDESSIKNDNYWRVHRAIEWARNADAQYPGICSRLQLGRDWNSSTRQLLGIDPLEETSPLTNAVYSH